MFSEVKDLESAVNDGAKQASSCWNSGTGTFSLPSNENMLWAEKIENKSFEKNYKINRPKGMSDKDYQLYLTTLRGQEKDLRMKDGWDNSSIKEYFKQLNNQTKKLSGLEALSKTTELYNQTRIAGSELFLKMWNAWDTETSQFDAKRKLDVLLNIVQVTTELPNDPNEVMKLLDKFDKNLAPDSKFWRSLADEVQKAFPKPEILSGDFGKKINNLRYVSSAQQAEYIREKYKGDTDQEKLAAYLSSIDRDKYDLGESDRLHQKKSDKGWPEGYGGGNIKIVIDFNTEFILNGEGRFQNIIDPRGSSVNGVVNGASFNYAHKNDYKASNSQSPDSFHGRLDVRIGGVDPSWRTETIDNNGKEYNYPGKKEYINSSGKYSIDGSSVKDNSDKLKSDLKAKIEEKK